MSSFFENVSNKQQELGGQLPNFKIYSNCLLDNRKPDKIHF